LTSINEIGILKARQSRRREKRFNMRRFGACLLCFGTFRGVTRRAALPKNSAQSLKPDGDASSLRVIFFPQPFKNG
jgi:hypothetical protein